MNSKLREIRESLFESNPTTAFNRRDQVVLTRLRIGHTNMSHIHLITKEDKKKCNECDEPLSVKHLFLCPNYVNQRRKQQISSNMKETLNNEESCKKFIKYLKDINVYNSI